MATRSVDIRVDADTRQAVSGMDRLDRAIGGVGRGVGLMSAGLRGAMSGVGRAMDGVNTAMGIMTRGIELAGQAADALGIDLSRASNAIGSLVNAAAEAGTGSSLSTMFDEFIDDIGDATTRTGKFAREGLAVVVEVGTAVAVTIARVVQGVQALVSSVGIAQSWLEQQIANVAEGEGAAGVATRGVSGGGRLAANRFVNRVTEERGQISAAQEARDQIQAQLTAQFEDATSEFLSEVGSMESFIESLTSAGASAAESFRTLGDVTLETTETTRSHTRHTTAATAATRSWAESLGELAGRLVDTRDTLGGQLGGALGDLARTGQDLIAGRSDRLKAEREAEAEEAASRIPKGVVEEIGGQVDMLADTMQGMWDGLAEGTASSLGDTFEAVGVFVGGVNGSFKSLGQSIKASLGGTFSGIGRSFLSAASQALIGGASGPLGWFALAGGLFSLVGGLLTGSGGGNVGASIGAASSTPEALTAIRPDFQGAGGRSVVQNFNVGAILTSRDAGEAVDQLTRDNMRRGASVFNELGLNAGGA